MELRDGQSFAIAGLAILAQILTRSHSFHGSDRCRCSVRCSAARPISRRKPIWSIIVTPRLIGPAVPGQRLASPLESRLPANDVDFFLNGQPEVKKRYQDYITTGGQLKGPYGHLIEVETGPSGPVGKK